ncbi:MAG: hypothetical protein HFJ38_02715 [Bacilli bacterium]|nr:hypothetical protein [Bacilli bacterium]
MPDQNEKAIEGRIQTRDCTTSILWLQKRQKIYSGYRITVNHNKRYFGIIKSYDFFTGRTVLSKPLMYRPLMNQPYLVYTKKDANKFEDENSGNDSLQEEDTVLKNHNYMTYIENEANALNEKNKGDDDPSIIPLDSPTSSLFSDRATSLEDNLTYDGSYTSQSNHEIESSYSESSQTSSSAFLNSTSKQIQSLAAAESLHQREKQSTGSSKQNGNGTIQGSTEQQSGMSFLNATNPNLLVSKQKFLPKEIEGDISDNLPLNDSLFAPRLRRGRRIGAGIVSSVSDDKLNFGRVALVSNPNMAEPDKTSLDQEKEKNADRLQDIGQKNAIRSIQNAIYPNLPSEEKDQEDEDTSSDESEENSASDSDDEKSRDDSPKDTKMQGTITLKQIKIALFVASFFFFLFLLSLPILAVSRFGNLVGIDSGGTSGDASLASGNDEDLLNLYNNIKDIEEEYSSRGKKFSGDLIVSIYHILNSYSKNGFSAYDMNNNLIRTIVDKMFKETCSEDDEKKEHCTYGYSEEILREYLKNDLFPKYIKNHNIDDAVDEVFTYISDYAEVTGGHMNQFGGGCFIGGNTQASSGIFNHMSTEEYLNFMGPIANQVYAETGIFASVTLAQSIIEAGWGKHTPANSNNLFGIKCGGTGHPPSTWDGSCSSPVLTQEDYGGTGNYTTITSRFRSYKNVEEGILDHGALLVNGATYVRERVVEATSPQDQIARIKAAGYATDSKYVNKIIDTINLYNLEKWDTRSASVCSSTADGDFSSWKQSDSRWGSIHLGNSSDTISSAGCLVTSLAMLIMKYQIPTTITGEFNPGTFVESLNVNHGFDGALFRWDLSAITPSFKRVQNLEVLGQNKNQKLRIIKDGLDKGYAVMVEVKGNTGQHWVAVDSVSGSDVIMMDPGSQATNMWDQYNVKNTSRIVYFGTN